MNIAARIDHSVESEIWLNAEGRFPQQLLYKSWEHFGGGRGGLELWRKQKPSIYLISVREKSWHAFEGERACAAKSA